MRLVYQRLGNEEKKFLIEKKLNELINNIQNLSVYEVKEKLVCVRDLFKKVTTSK